MRAWVYQTVDVNGGCIKEANELSGAFEARVQPPYPVGHSHYMYV